MAVDLALQLREGTKKAHTMAENTGFVTCFLKGVVDKVSYRKLVADLFFVYSAMEEEIGKLSAHPVVGPISFSQLNRRPSLEQDLAFYFGADWRSQIKATPGAKAYVARIHQYTRYIGDLSGGQILKSIAQKAMSLGQHDGLRFYEFDTIEDEKSFKTNYRAVLDNLPIDQPTADCIVVEANEAFNCNMVMFQELEGNLIAAIGKVLFGFLTRRQRTGSTEAFTV
jgi:heme oxygenase (biliverdin-producing, ferredoxin)